MVGGAWGEGKGLGRGTWTVIREWSPGRRGWIHPHAVFSLFLRVPAGLPPVLCADGHQGIQIARRVGLPPAISVFESLRSRPCGGEVPSGDG